MSQALPHAPSRTPRGLNKSPAAVPFVAIAVLIVVAVFMGGGGARYGLLNLCVQLTALAVLAINREAVWEFWTRAPMALRILVGLSVMVPVLQLIPLPEPVWSALPGRELVKQSFELIGRSGWAPASVDPIRTLVALTGLIVPVTILSAGWALSHDRLVLVGWIVIGLGLANVVLGIAQVTSLGSTGNLYDGQHADVVLKGTFANRNSTGVFLIAALAFAAVLPAPIRHPIIAPARVGCALLLITAIILTQSRTALVISALPMALAALRLISWTREANLARHFSGSKRMRLIIPGAIALVLAAAAAVIVAAPGRVGDTIERFESRSDARTYIWEDSEYAASRYAPFGSGMGTFDEVFQVDESLENTTVRRAGRAHNDYLEVLIEAGAPGMVLILCWLLLVGWLCWRARGSEWRWIAWGGGAVLLAIALQSITDYPLRNQAMLAIASFALLLLARSAMDRGGETQ